VIEPVIEAEDVAKRFGQTQALAGVSLSCPRALSLALLGPNVSLRLYSNSVA